MSLRAGMLVPHPQKKVKKAFSFTARIPDLTVQPCLLKGKKKKWWLRNYINTKKKKS